VAASASKRTPRRPGATVPKGYDIDQYPRFAVTVDVVILTVTDGDLQVLLVHRKDAPFKRHWALPGGFKRPDESIDDAARRELHEEAGIDAPAHLAQFGAYGDPGRDPRGNVVTVGYLAVTATVDALQAGTDADEARMWSVAEVLDGYLDLAFDHEQILRDAVQRAAERLEDTDLATAFVGPRFTLSELQSVYEALWGEELDPANFRRSVLSASPVDEIAYVEATDERAPSTPKGGRPPALFAASPAWQSTGSPVKRSRRRSPRSSPPSG
jgi:8-oxo-dGTP diphosphatase